METIQNAAISSPSRETIEKVEYLLAEMASRKGQRKATAEAELRAMGIEGAMAIGSGAGANSQYYRATAVGNKAGTVCSPRR